MNEELKPNMCKIDYRCEGSKSTPCAYKKTHGKPPTGCIYLGRENHYECVSAVARVNAMVIELKKHGIDFQNRDFIKKIGDLLQKSLDSKTGLKSVDDAMDMINEHLYPK